jgi:DNA polymerase-3 subunit gamma/tau
MGQALYRKYRSKSLSEIIGQEHITKTLEQALKSGRISHAYLFTGPHGVGKTSIARILAHEVNGLPYDDDSSHIDIIEIDAASNRRIDEIRELREKVYVAPTSAKYKVYIIDEVHMLTREAFNALLKTLEEPPAHVIFILATTDAHKLPETIISRTQRFTFKPVEQEKVVAHLKKIAKNEKLKVSDEALELLAKHGEGSFRDSISLLDQASGQGSELTAAGVLSLLGIPPDTALEQLLTALATPGSPGQLFENLESLYAQGYQAAAIAKQLGQLLRAQLVQGRTTLQSAQTLALLRELLEVPSSSDPDRLLEIILLQTGKFTASQQITAESPPIAAKPKSKEEPQTLETPPPPIKVTQTEVPKVVKAATAEPKPVLTLTEAVWPDVLSALKKKHNTV